MLLPFFHCKRKAQAIIFENVLIFTIGVAIFIVCYAVFNIYQYTYFGPIGTADHLEGTADYIASYILLLAENPGVNSSLEINIPISAGPEQYNIKLSSNGLNLTTASGMSRTSPLFGLNRSFVLTGEVTSAEGRITLKKRGNQISIS